MFLICIVTEVSKYSQHNMLFSTGNGTKAFYHNYTKAKKNKRKHNNYILAGNKRSYVDLFVHATSKPSRKKHYKL